MAQNRILWAHFTFQVSSQQMTIFFLGYNIHSESYDVSYVVSFFVPCFIEFSFTTTLSYFTRNIFRSAEPGADDQHCVRGPLRHPLRARLLPGGGRLVPRGPQTVPGCQALLRWAEERLSLLEKYNYQSEMKNHKSHYISDKLRTASPVHNIHIECFHTETKSAINTFKGNILTK